MKGLWESWKELVKASLSAAGMFAIAAIVAKPTIDLILFLNRWNWEGAIPVLQLLHVLLILAVVGLAWVILYALFQKNVQDLVDRMRNGK